MPNEKKIKHEESVESIAKEEAKERMDRFFKDLEDKFKDVPEEEFKKAEDRIQDFISGKINWAEASNFPKHVMYVLAKHGYAHFKSGRYEDAEKIYKVLSYLDIDNPYFHTMMGAILQRQKRYDEAVAEYTMAIDLDPNDITSLVNRGEIYLTHGIYDRAKTDFQKAIELDINKNNRWAARAKLLMGNIKEGDE